MNRDAALIAFLDSLVETDPQRELLAAFVEACKPVEVEQPKKGKNVA